MNIKAELEKAMDVSKEMQLNTFEIEPLAVKTIMINEVVPSDPLQDFYGQPDADYVKTIVPLFQKAGCKVSTIQDILQMGVYITNAVKTPKAQYVIEKSSIENSLPYLEKEIALFPNVKVIMLMGDVAKKAYNLISKKATKKNAVPAVSTYKSRNGEFYYGSIRIMPSHSITGKNILIEKSKFEMAAEDIAIMLDIIK